MLCTTKKEKTLRMGSHRRPLLQSWYTKALYLQSTDRWEINLCKKGTTKKLQVSTMTPAREEAKNLPWEFEPQASSLESEVLLSVWSTKACTVDLIHTDLSLVVLPDDCRSRCTSSLEKFGLNLDQWQWLDTFQYERCIPVSEVNVPFRIDKM